MTRPAKGGKSGTGSAGGKSGTSSRGSAARKAGGRNGKPGRRDARADARHSEADEPREVRAGTQAGYHAPTRSAHRKGVSKKLIEKERAEAPMREQREREQREYERRQRELAERELAVRPATPERRDHAGPSAPPRRSLKAGVPAKSAPSKGAPAKGTPAKGALRPKPPRPQAPRPAPVVSAPQPEAPTVPDSGLIVRVSRMLNVPASAVFRAINDPDKRGWAPTQLFRIVSVLAPRFIRLAFPDGTLVAIAVARQGNARCTVSLELTKLPLGTDERVVKATWDEALSGLQEQLDTSWD